MEKAACGFLLSLRSIPCSLLSIPYPLFSCGCVESGLGAGEELAGVGVGVEVDEDFGVGDGVVDAVGEGVAEGLEEVEGAFVAGGIAVVADDGEDGAMGAEGGDGDEISKAGAEFVRARRRGRCS